MPARKTQVVIARKRLELSNLDKLMYPAADFTKGDVIGYYRAISEVMLPHLKDRAVTLKRYVDGVEGDFFFEKQCPKHRPGWIRTVRMHDRKVVDYCLINTEAALTWAANLASLELHTSLAKARNVNRPRFMVFDLDPGEGTDIVDCAEVGLLIREVLEEHGPQCFPKTSGSKGLQLYVPLNNSTATYEQTKSFAHTLARSLAEREPDRILTSQSRAERGGKILIDWSQNDTHRTMVCAYSLRAKERPTVSTPVTWEEVAGAARTGKADLLRFEQNEVLERVDKEGDLFEPVLRVRQRLPELA